MEVEDDVELADVAEVAVEDLDEEVDHLVGGKEGGGRVDLAGSVGSIGGKSVGAMRRSGGSYRSYAP